MGLIKEPEAEDKTLHTDISDFNLETDDAAQKTNTDLPNVTETTPVYAGEMTLTNLQEPDFDEPDEGSYVAAKSANPYSHHINLVEKD